MTTVIKIGGSLLSEGNSQEIIKNVAKFSQDRVILVHGGGPSVTNLCRDLGIEPKFVTSPSGIKSRLTDIRTMQAFIMAMRGKVNSEIVLEMQRHGARSFGMSGIDGPTIIAERKKRLLIVNERGRKMFIDGGYTGRVVHVDPFLMLSLLDSGLTPVISPIAVSQEQEPLNIDGDRAASAIASSIKADRLILLTNVEGVILKDSLVREISYHDLDDFVKEVGNGMDKKLIAAREALEGGAAEVIISNGNLENPIDASVNSDNRTVIRK